MDPTDTVVVRPDAIKPRNEQQSAIQKNSAWKNESVPEKHFQTGRETPHVISREFEPCALQVGQPEIAREFSRRVALLLSGLTERPVLEALARVAVAAAGSYLSHILQDFTISAFTNI
jgi:hypothetical protein